MSVVTPESPYIATSMQKRLVNLHAKTSPKYKADGKYQGYIAISYKAWRGRFVSLLDIPSAILTGAAVGVVAAAISVTCVVQVPFYLLKALGCGLITLCTWNNPNKKEMWNNSAKRAGNEALDSMIGIVTTPIWGLYLMSKSALRVLGSVAGVLLPEVGRISRRGKAELD